MLFKTHSFKHPVNGYIKTVTIDVWIFAALFGAFYFAYKGVWSHALISLVLAILTGGISHLIYCWFARGILKEHYLTKGWTEI